MSHIGEIRPQTAEDAQEDCSWSGGLASVSTIYTYAGNDPINKTDPTGTRWDDHRDEYEAANRYRLAVAQHLSWVKYVPAWSGPPAWYVGPGSVPPNAPTGGAVSTSTHQGQGAISGLGPNPIAASGTTFMGASDCGCGGLTPAQENQALNQLGRLLDPRPLLNAIGNAIGSIFGAKSNDLTTQRPTDAPPGTRPINTLGLDKDTVHEIKEAVGAGSQQWTGVTPDGRVITTDSEGNAIDNGPADSMTSKPTGLGGGGDD